MNPLKDKVDEYINDHRLSWAPSTLRSERHRLYSVAPLLTGDPLSLWDALQILKPYSRVTTWTRVVSFWSWLKPDEVNPYETFRKKNARLFKYSYQPKEVEIDYNEAVVRIRQIRNEHDRRLALQILSSGERYCESRQRPGTIIGKGSKPRVVYRFDVTEQAETRSYSSLARSLSRVGLRAHVLRKLCATRLVEEGMNEADLMKVMGWSSIVTAKAYLQPKREAEIRAIFHRLHAELK